MDSSCNAVLCVLIGAMFLLPAWAVGETVQARPRLASPWQEYQTRTFEDVKGLSSAPIPINRYGGRTDRKEKATGFFHAAKIDGRWWIVDPEGGLFVHVAVVGLKPNQKYGSTDAFSRLFGSDDKWANTTTKFLRQYGFNGIGSWSATETLRKVPQPLPYTVYLGLMSSFGHKIKVAHQASGHAGYVNDCIPVFHPDFPAFCEERCAKLAELKDDRYLLGYFSDNEMPAPRDMLEKMMSLDRENPEIAPLRKAAWHWIIQRKGHEPNKKEITDADREAFLGYVYETYLRIVTDALRKADPNHMYLGPRFHNPQRNSPSQWAAAGKYCDVIAMNYYGTWTPRKEDMANWAKWSGKPCMITEFYVKADDSGMKNSTGAGWIVKTQKDRGLFYQNYTLGLLESKTCVGWHWFKYMDNDPANPNVDPSNRDSNKGIVNVRYDPYLPLLEKMKPINQNVYSLIDCLDRK